MFGDSQRDKAEYLSAVERQARNARNGNWIEAKQELIEAIGRDRRFDGFDAEALAARVQLCKTNGAILDLEDPALMKGGSPRPLSR
jgi:hypothetical protein